MSQWSRRDLLLGAFAKKPVEARKVIVGRLKEFPVGEQKTIAREQILIESLPEGLRAKSTSKSELFFGIEMNSRGEIVVDFSRTCLPDEVFSVMTNETIRLNKEMNV
jgi:hypothetical protein